jgi:hypothetical protein
MWARRRGDADFSGEFLTIGGGDGDGIGKAMGGGNNQGTVAFDKRPRFADLFVIIIGWER